MALSTSARVMNKEEVRRGFSIFWQEPPATTGGWTANVASENPRLNLLMGHHGAEIIVGRTRDDMIAKARKYIDELLG
jgi:hypothetical protein